MGNGRSRRQQTSSHVARQPLSTSSSSQLHRVGGQQQSNGHSATALQRGGPGNRASMSRRAAAPSSPVRCPRCRRLLQPPSGHERFLCPCGQMLMAPSPQRLAQQQEQMRQQGVSRPPAAPQHVRCPTCNTTLAPPPGAPVFRCPCGTHLRAPNVAAMQQSTRAMVPPGAEGKEIGADLMASDVVASYVQRRAEQQWMREPSEDGNALVWRNLQSDEEERRKLMLEERCLAQLAENVEKLNTKQLYEKLEAMQISTEACENKADLQEALRNAPATLRALPAQELAGRLDTLGVSYDDLTAVEEMANRLLAAAWYDGLYDDGYVRQILDDSSLAWIPATKYALEVTGVALSARDLWHVSAQPFADKLKWFSGQVKALKTPWEKGHAQIKVRRHELLRDAFTTFNKLRPEDLRRHFRFEFIGEAGLDAGGVAREFFELVSDSIFNVDFGLFEYSGVDNICYSINPSSGIANELDMRYFYFLGRVMGKALFEGHVIPAHLTRPMYKHLLGFPITAADVEFVDPIVHKSMLDIKECDDVEVLYLDFTTATRVFGETQTVELRENGADHEVTNENREQYLHLLVKFIMFDRIAPQLAMLLKGFYEVIPAPLLTVFDYQELELLMCGLPNIDVADWRRNTTYRGAYTQKGEKHNVVAWFWETMEEFSQEQRAKFLQFATGTSRVPVQGFGALQSSDGNIKLFTIDSIKFDKSVFPRAHTCFNRIDLPLYRSKQELRRYILQALSLEAVGFADE